MTFNWAKFGFIASRPWTAAGWVKITQFSRKFDFFPPNTEKPTLAWYCDLKIGNYGDIPGLKTFNMCKNHL